MKALLLNSSYFDTWQILLDDFYKKSVDEFSKFWRTGLTWYAHFNLQFLQIEFALFLDFVM